MFIGRVNWSSYNAIIEFISKAEKLANCQFDFTMCVLDKENTEYNCDMKRTMAFFYHNEPYYPDDWCGEYLTDTLANKWYRESGIVYRVAAHHTMNINGMDQKVWFYDGVSMLNDMLLLSGKFTCIGDVGKVFYYFKDINPDSSDLLHTALPKSQPLSVSSLYS